MLSCQNISKKYGSLEVLKGVDLHIQKGEVVSLVGSSGAGKSTLLHILGLLDEPDSGSVELNGKLMSFASRNKLVPVAWWKRLLNGIVDTLQVASIIYLCFRLIETVTEGVIADSFWKDLIFGITGTAVWIAYYVLLESFTGRTLGKLITGSKVITTKSTKADWKTIFLRTVFRYIPFEQFSFLKKNPAGWHDSLSSTLVVDRKVPYMPFEFDDNQIAIFRNKHIGFVFQFHHLLPEFTALENVCIPGWLGGRNKKEVEKRAKELLVLLGLSARMDNKPSALSGGEQQRVAVARALINNPDIILADEPTGNLDSANAKELHQLFFDLRKQFNQTFLIVTHNSELAAQCDRTIQMKDGRILIAGSNKE